MLDEAKLHLGSILSTIQDSSNPNAAGIAAHLERGGLPGDEELAYYAMSFQMGIPVKPKNNLYACPIIFGHGPVGFAVEHTLSAPDEQGRFWAFHAGEILDDIVHIWH